MRHHQTVDDLEGTRAFAARLAAGLRPGDALCLRGPLGAGKSEVARAILRRLGVVGEIPSPSFNIALSYETEIGPVWHFDFYRLASPGELAEIGVEDALAEATVLIEWPERMGPYLPDRRIDLEMAHGARPEQRHLTLRADDDVLARLLGAHDDRIDRFLEQSGWATAARRRLVGDASTRVYQRLTSADGTAIMMDARADPAVTARFGRIGGLLRALGLAAPRTLAADTGAGLLLVEDFGDDTFATLLGQGAAPAPLYHLAVDVLIAIHRGFKATDGKGLPRFDPDRFAEQSLLFLDAHAPLVRPEPVQAAARGRFEGLIRELLASAFEVPDSLLLRDFHAGNLILRPDVEGIMACGLIDFEDAGLGPVSYDLASLLQDARLDPPADLEADCLARYLAAFPDLDRAAFTRSYKALAAVRHLRVLAVFARLAAGGRDAYLTDHGPRLWRYLRRGGDEPALAALMAWLAEQGLDRSP